MIAAEVLQGDIRTAVRWWNGGGGTAEGGRRATVTCGGDTEGNHPPRQEWGRPG